MEIRGGAVSPGAKTAAACSPGKKNRGGGLGAWRGGLARASRREVGPGGLQGGRGGTPEVARAAGVRGKTTAAAACRAPLELEVEEGDCGLICKNRKVQGLHCKIIFSIDLWLK